ncbi:MAG TPA: OsmC family protein [Gemmatimonadaceae bacterium]|nr:OsmC family protein [Gemmatimonadaceae bacterium]
MKLLLLSEDAIRLEVDPGPIRVESVEPDLHFSAFHMLAEALAYCTFSVLYTWAEQSHQPTDDLALEVRWAFSDDAPRRIREIHMTFQWPSLPEKKREAASRVADFCPIHETLRISPVVTTAPAESNVAG